MPNEQELNADHPIVTYSNRIQKHMFLLTQELTDNNSIEMTEKRKLKLLIANLPPQAKEVFQEITYKLEGQTPITTVAFDAMYSKVSDWIYVNILQDAFRAIPLYRDKGTLAESTKRVSDKKEGMF